ncbi:putative MFS transporter, AGZA family, xanthine/uracil permease [Thalassobacillus cyri]|uniref:Putative MFS transporter, AGZA family, xanthine/uracil permease n=1 Tax=Thalassobacillus cyri TaxID=571932 RepID=A0A1H4HCZ8_9BACI|nr:NCS2 family permease [Thalassobacillus cyri]SEB19654.1 putative MFS transporter, AGZA family, xanthine/uracil permease [Thalassobacillus cyri]
MFNKHKHDIDAAQWKNDVLAGFIGYFTTVYIVAVNSSILNDAGIGVENAMVATILASFVGTLLMGLLANAPMVLIPGMGVNALFAYTIVEGTGMSFQEGLAVVIVSSLIFLLTAFTKLGEWLKEAIPDSLKHAITVGLGLFLTLIGLEKGGLVVRGEHSLITLGNPSSEMVITSLLTLFIAIFLFTRNVPGNFLVTMIIGTVIAYFFGLLGEPGKGISMEMDGFVWNPSFAGIGSLTFWMAVFPLSIVLIFENMGLIHGQLAMLNNEGKFKRAYQATAFSALASGFLGTSPTVSSAESAAVIASKGKTGRAAITMAILFLVTLLLIPWISMVPSTAISPILIIVGALMVQNIKHIELDQLSEAMPSFLIIVMIPFTYSIADGMAFGFIAYPLVKLAIGKQRELSFPVVFIAMMFLFEFVMRSVGH